MSAEQREAASLADGTAIGTFAVAARHSLPVWLLLVALYSATFSRIAQAAFGVPYAVHWIHFPLVAVAFVLALRRIEDEAAPLVAGCGALLAVFAASAWLNGAGAINAVLGYALLAEPWLFLAVLANERARRSTADLAWWVLALAFAQIPLALAQVPHSRAIHNPDVVQGSFTGMGAGHHVMGAISAATAIYLLWRRPIRNAWLTWTIVVVLASLVVLSDSKQVILAFGVAFVLLRSPRMRQPREAMRLSAGILFGAAVVYIALRAFARSYWLDHLEGLAAALSQKLVVFPLLVEHFHAWWQWFFGLGPGHGVARLGGWLLDVYWNRLEPYGATRTDIAREAWHASRYARISSLFAPLFSWAGIFGDIGLAGVAVYGALLSVTYRRLCRDDFARLVVLAIVIFGFVFDWLEEFNFMLYAMALIGIGTQYAPLPRSTAPIVFKSTTTSSQSDQLRT